MRNHVTDRGLLTHRQRRQLAALGRRLAQEDPELAGALSRPALGARSQLGRRASVGMLWTGFLLLLTGAFAGVGPLVALALVLLSTSWLPVFVSRPGESMFAAGER